METHIKKFIKDSIEGGWGAHVSRQMHDWRDENGDFRETPLNCCFTDPKFWQAVGKTRGWKTAHCYMCKTDVHLWGECNCDEDEVTPVAHMAWQFQWHTFIDHLADGLTIEEALTKLK